MLGVLPWSEMSVIKASVRAWNKDAKRGTRIPVEVMRLKGGPASEMLAVLRMMWGVLFTLRASVS